jgi:lysophospholipase L1-like esterase
MTDFYTPQKDQVASGILPAEQPGLPKVLLIGDSISQGYTQPVAQLLLGQCNVRRPRANCGDTRAGLANLDDWLGDVQWDLIHFNFGLHDLCYRHPEATEQGNRDKINGTISVPADEYEQNLDQIAKRLSKQSGKLIWCSTTYVPEGEAGRHVGDDIRYNQAAARVMAKHDVPTNDLHALSAAFAAELFIAPGNVHFTDEGSAQLAQQVAACIRSILEID